MVATDEPSIFWKAIAAIVVVAGLAYLPSTQHYFYYDDGLLLHCARQTLETDASVPWRFSFHGHWRPLPILSSTLLLRLFGAKSAVPFHCFALVLHSINIVLAGILFSRWAPGRPWIVLAAMTLFAVHGSASEAVTYWSSVGVLWSAMGGWLAAWAMTNLREERRVTSGTSLLLIAGVILSIGGGEYCLATVPLILFGGLLPTGRPHARPVVVATASIIAVFVVYCFAMALLDPRERIGDAYRFGVHLPWRIVENIGQMLLPKGIVDKDVGLMLGFATLIGAVVFACRRSSPREPLVLLFFGAAIASLLPFAPSLLGNYPRFVYIATPLFMTAAMLVISDLFLRIHASTARVKGWMIGLVGCWVVLQWTGLEVRVARAGHRAEAVAQLMASVEGEITRHPGQKLRIVLTAPDIESIGGLISARGLSERVSWHHSPRPNGRPLPGVTWMIVESRLRRGFRCEILRSRTDERGRLELSEERRTFPL